MKIKSMKTLYMIVIGFAAVLMAFNAFAVFGKEVLKITTPECQEHVKVVEKRIETTTVYDAAVEHSSVKYYHLATFEFSDGSKKEFNIGISYNDIYIGDTGMLTYHEKKI